MLAVASARSERRLNVPGPRATASGHGQFRGSRSSRFLARVDLRLVLRLHNALLHVLDRLGSGRLRGVAGIVCFGLPQRVRVATGVSQADTLPLSPPNMFFSEPIASSGFSRFGKSFFKNLGIMVTLLEATREGMPWRAYAGG